LPDEDESAATSPAGPGEGPAEAPPRLSLTSYHWLNFLMVPVVIVTFLGLGAVWAALLHYLGEQHAQTFGPAVYLFKPPYWAVCAVPGLFLGIFGTIPLLMLLARLLMGRRRFLEYLHWDEGRLGAENVDRIVRGFSGLALVLAVLCALFVALAFHWYARLTEDGIAVKRLLGAGEEFHPYGSAVQLVLTTHRRQGKQVVDAEDLGLRFADGSTWGTDQTFSLPHDPQERARLLDFLAHKTGQSYVRVRLLEDAPGWQRP
jgi:hypothetical protein